MIHESTEWWIEWHTIHPLPSSRRQTGFLLHAYPNKLRLQVGFPPLQFCVQEGGGGRWHAVHQVAGVTFAVGPRLCERSTASHAELVTRPREGGNLSIFRGASGCAAVHGKFCNKKEDIFSTSKIHIKKLHKEKKFFCWIDEKYN